MANQILSNDPAVKNYENSTPSFAENCPFCGNPFVYQGIILDNSNDIHWYRIPKVCGCPKAQEKEAKRIANEKADQEWRKQQEEERRLQAEQQAKREAYARYKSRLQEMGLSERQASHTFKNFEVTEGTKNAFLALQNYAQNFDSIFRTRTQNPCNGIFLFGPVGLGKTHLSSAVVLAVGRTHEPYIVSMVNLIEELKRSFNESSFFNEAGYIFTKCLNAELLVIDDLGKEKPSSWSLSKLYEIINHRYEALLPTIITSNHSPEELEEIFNAVSPSDTVIAQAIIDRILESSHVISVSGESYRLRRFKIQ